MVLERYAAVPIIGDWVYQGKWKLLDSGPFRNRLFGIGFRVERIDRMRVSCVPLKKEVEEISRKPVPGKTENKLEPVPRSDRQIIHINAPWTTRTAMAERSSRVYG